MIREGITCPLFCINDFIKFQDIFFIYAFLTNKIILVFETLCHYSLFNIFAKTSLWNVSQNLCLQQDSSLIRTLIMHSMAEYYVEGEQTGDTTRLGRIFDIIADVKVSLWNLFLFFFKNWFYHLLSFSCFRRSTCSWMPIRISSFLTSPSWARNESTSNCKNGWATGYKNLAWVNFGAWSMYMTDLRYKKSLSLWSPIPHDALLCLHNDSLTYNTTFS